MIDDPALPAAATLTGPDAGDILRPAVEQAGGRLYDHRCVHVQYRPGSDIVAQFRVEVAWGDGERRRDTVIAGLTTTGAPQGTVPVVATTGDTDLEVGVWRWPFDPVLHGLDQAVRPAGAAAMLRDLGLRRPLDVSVVAYRPTERAVVRVRGGDRVVYLKLVRPDRMDELVLRHRRLGEAGLPVPEILAVDVEQGWLAMTELAGQTSRERIKTREAVWMRPDSLRDIVDRLRSIDAAGLPLVRSRLADAPIHAAVLASVVPELDERLASLGAIMEAEHRLVVRSPAVVHGDLHEGQLIVDDHGAITGLLDVDGVGRGDPVDDIAVPIAHLRDRAAMADVDAERLSQHANDLAEALGHDVAEKDLAVATAAVAIGLATGPFCRQGHDWRRGVADAVGLAERLLGTGR